VYVAIRIERLLSVDLSPPAHERVAVELPQRRASAPLAIRRQSLDLRGADTDCRGSGLSAFD
jgi:hypothetical protein